MAHFDKITQNTTKIGKVVECGGGALAYGRPNIGTPNEIDCENADY